MYKNVEEIYTKNFEQGYMDEATKHSMIENSLKRYPNLPKEILKHIATFDAGLISMQIMLLAKDMGYNTVTMGGFNKEAFAKN